MEWALCCSCLLQHRRSSNWHMPLCLLFHGISAPGLPNNLNYASQTPRCSC